jgi:hypothetical protein
MAPPPPPHVISRRAAIKALFTVASDEARRLYAVVESQSASPEEKQRALNEVGALSADTLGRLAEIQKAYDPDAESRKPDHAGKVIEMPSVADSEEEAEAA